MTVHIADVQIPDARDAPIWVDFRLHNLRALVVERRSLALLQPADWHRVSGVYALLTNDVSGKAYVGKSDNLLKRMNDHDKNPPLNWSRALLFKKEGSPSFAFGTADIAHLEQRLHAEVSAMAVMTLVNTQVPKGGNVPPNQRLVLDQLVPTMLAALRLAGIDTRQRVSAPPTTGTVRSSRTKVPTSPASAGRTSMRAVKSGSIGDLIRHGLLKAGDQVVLVKGGNVIETATIDPSGTIQLNGVTYDNPSAPATLAFGRNANGWEAWRVGGPNGPNLASLRAQVP